MQRRVLPAIMFKTTLSMWHVKNEKAFEKFKKIHGYVIFNVPEMFPFFVYFTVTHWGSQEETAEYLYEKDLKGMLGVLRGKIREHR